MIWPVTIASTLVGLAVAHIPGALLGALVGSIVDRNLAISSWFELRERLSLSNTPALNAQQVLFMLLGHLAKSTGQVTAEHIHAARVEMQRLQLTGITQKLAIAAFSRGKHCRLADLRSGLLGHYAAVNKAEGLLQAGWRMALAQGMPTVKQQRMLQQCADWLGCSAQDFERIEAQAMHGRLRPSALQSELDAALQLLGVNRSDNWLQVKKAYRRQISLYHPDKLMGAGATSAQVDIATEQTRALHHAYAEARKHWQN